MREEVVRPDLDNALHIGVARVVGGRGNQKSPSLSGISRYCRIRRSRKPFGEYHAACAADFLHDFRLITL